MPSSTNSAVPPTGVVRFGYPAEPPTLDPLAAGGDSAPTRDVLRPLLPALFEQDAHLRPHPSLAARWPRRADFAFDPFSVTVTLRRANWSDGRAITAGDVRFSWTKLRAGPNGYRYRHLTDVVVVGPRSVRLRFDRIVRRWWALFSLDDMVLPAHAYGASWAHGPTVSGGPFAFKSWTPGLGIDLVRNDAYWGTKAGVSEIDVEFVADDETSLQLLDSNGLDTFFDEGGANVGRRARAHGYSPVQGALTGKAGGATGAWGPSWFELDLDPLVLGSATARAVQQALDPNLVAEMLEDSGRTADGIPAAFAPDDPRADGPWQGRGDLTRAAQLLAQSRGGSRSFPIAYEHGSSAGAIATFAHFRLSGLGITAELVGLDAPPFERSWLPGRKSPAILRLRRGADAPDVGAYASASVQAGSGPVDDQVEAATTTVDRGALLAGPVTGVDAAAWTAVEERLASAATTVPLARTRTWIVGRAGLAGPQAVGSVEGPLWNAADWRVHP